MILAVVYSVVSCAPLLVDVGFGWLGREWRLGQDVFGLGIEGKGRDVFLSARVWDTFLHLIVCGGILSDRTAASQHVAHAGVEENSAPTYYGGLCVCVCVATHATIPYSLGRKQIDLCVVYACCILLFLG